MEVPILQKRSQFRSDALPQISYLLSFDNPHRSLMPSIMISLLQLSLRFEKSANSSIKDRIINKITSQSESFLISNPAYREYIEYALRGINYITNPDQTDVMTRYNYIYHYFQQVDFINNAILTMICIIAHKLPEKIYQDLLKNSIDVPHIFLVMEVVSEIFDVNIIIIMEDESIVEKSAGNLKPLMCFYIMNNGNTYPLYTDEMIELESDPDKINQFYNNLISQKVQSYPLFSQNFAKPEENNKKTNDSSELSFGLVPPPVKSNELHNHIPPNYDTVSQAIKGGQAFSGSFGGENNDDFDRMREPPKFQQPIVGGQIPDPNFSKLNPQNSKASNLTPYSNIPINNPGSNLPSNFQNTPASNLNQAGQINPNFNSKNQNPPINQFAQVPNAISYSSVQKSFPESEQPALSTGPPGSKLFMNNPELYRAQVGLNNNSPVVYHPLQNYNQAPPPPPPPPPPHHQQAPHPIPLKPPATYQQPNPSVVQNPLRQDYSNAANTNLESKERIPRDLINYLYEIGQTLKKFKVYDEKLKDSTKVICQKYPEIGYEYRDIILGILPQVANHPAPGVFHNDQDINNYAPSGFNQYIPPPNYNPAAPEFRRPSKQKICKCHQALTDEDTFNDISCLECKSEVCTRCRIQDLSQCVLCGREYSKREKEELNILHMTATDKSAPQGFKSFIDNTSNTPAETEWMKYQQDNFVDQGIDKRENFMNEAYCEHHQEKISQDYFAQDIRCADGCQVCNRCRCIDNENCVRCKRAYSAVEKETLEVLRITS